MNENGDDLTRSMMLDGNAAAGVLYEIFSREMTVAPTECAACGRHSEIGQLLMFSHAPGMVLRCPACESVMIRISRIAEQLYLDARGATYLKFSV